MAQSPKIANLFGIDIELHWLSVVFLLLFLLLSVYLFLLMLLLLASVLLHELAHSVTSLHNKVKVSKIILILPIGGMSVLDDTNIDPKVEFNIALAGPIMSLLLGAFFGIFVAFTPPGLVTQVFQFMFEINILLGILNLLPAFPTDGGRVFRSWLERKRDKYTATMITVKTSKATMGLIVIATIFYLFAINASFAYKEMLFVITLFTIFFLYGGAEAEQQMATLRRNAAGISMKSAISKDFAFITPQASIKEIYNKIKKSKKHVIITKIGNEYAYVNVFDRRRLENARNAADLAVKVPNINIKTNIVDVMSMMENRESAMACIINKGKLEGVVSAQHLEAFITLHVVQKKLYKNKER